MRTFLVALTFAATAAIAPACGGSSQSVTSPSTVKCAVTANADPASFGPPGGAGTLSISTNRECQWTASATGDWIQLGSNQSGQGEGRVTFTVTANADPSVRRAAIAVGEQQVAISQEAAPCTFSVSPAGDSAPPSGGRRTLTITASSARCTWTAGSGADWLTIVEGAQGTGNGQVVYDVRATEGPERTGTLTVAGQTIRVTQGIGCIFTLSAAGASLPAAAGSASVQVATAAGCAWTAVSNAPWIAISTGGAGSGAAEVRFSVAANTGPERSGTVAVAGRTFTVSQASGCTFDLSAPGASLGTSAASGAVQVATAAQCAWTAASNAAWLTVTSGAGASGPGEVRYSVAANAGPERSAVLTIGGRTFTVTQASGCTYSVNPTSHSVGAGSESRSAQVTTADGCPWTAVSNAPWIGVTAGSMASGPGTAQFVINQNPGNERSGTLTIAGVTVTVIQGGGCDVVLAPPSVSLGAASQAGSVRVTATSAGCQWTAESLTSWIALTAGSTGWGNGEVQFVVQANTGPERTGTIRIAGRMLPVTQAGGSGFSSSPGGQ